MSLGLGSLLAMTVLLGIVAGAMPKSNSIPLLGKNLMWNFGRFWKKFSGYYILVVIILCALAVGVSMTFLTIGRRLVEKARIPSNFTYRLMFITPRLSPCFGNSGNTAQGFSGIFIQKLRALGKLYYLRPKYKNFFQPFTCALWTLQNGRCRIARVWCLATLRCWSSPLPKTTWSFSN